MDGGSAFVAIALSDLARAGTFAGLGWTGPDATVIAIAFHCGPIGVGGINGCAIEDVIDVLIRRLDRFQGGPFACPENGGAIAYLEGAKRLLLERTAARPAQGVEGTKAHHASER